MKNFTFCIFLFFSPVIIYGQTFNQSSDEVIDNYLSEPSQDQTPVDYEINQDYIDEVNGIRHVHALQQINGIYVLEGMLTISFTQDGNRIANDQFIDTDVNATSPGITADQAVYNALDFHQMIRPEDLSIKENLDRADQHVIYNRGEIAASDIQARLMYIQHRREEKLRLTWETQLHTPDRQNYWVSYVDVNTGQVIAARDYVLHCSFGEGLVYDNSPEEEKVLEAQRRKMHMESAHRFDKMIEKKQTHTSANLHATCNHDHGNKINKTSAVAAMNSYLVLDVPAEAPNDDTAPNMQTVVVTDGDPLASPNGWTSDEPGGTAEFSYTRGNNVWAFYDPNAAPLGGTPQPATSAQATSSVPVTGPSEFIYPLDETLEPEADTNRNAAIVNLFYWNNIIHDIFYHQGFTEAGRNFQLNNFMRGGLGNDDVLAQAQDGGGTNNANFLTLADGANGQMQMYIWTPGGSDSTVQIETVSPAANTVMDGDKFVGLQGALYNTSVPPPTVDIFANPVVAEYVLVNDGCGSSEGCGAGGGVGLAPCNNVTGKIVLIDRGSCSFVEKVDGAQKGGAAGVIIMNNNSTRPDEVVPMGGTDPTINSITIPSVMCSFNTGLKLKAAIASGSLINGALRRDNPVPPKRDGDFDNGIISHEYGHGISTRTSPQTATGGSLGGDEQGGEGWSDYYALFMSTSKSDLSAPTTDHPNGMLPDHGIGTYVTYDNFDGPGIRPRRYSVDMSVNNYTFAGSTNGGFGVTNPEITVPHGVGFIWCTMLWELTQTMIDEYGFYDGPGDEIEDRKYSPPVTGVLLDDINEIIVNEAGNMLAMKLIQNGIALQSASPMMTEMRDGIIRADSLLYDGFHECLIWEAFARRGLGSNTENLSNDLGDETDGYGVPASCNPLQVYFDIQKTAPTGVDNNSVFEYSIVVKNNSTTGTQATNILVTDILPAGLTYLSGTGAPVNNTGQSVVFTIPSLMADSSVELIIEVEVAVETATSRLEEYDFEPNDMQGWLPSSGGPNLFTLENDSAEAFSGASYFFCTNLGAGSSNQASLMSPILDTTIVNRQLRFWHHYDTDSGFDGGYVEYTLDNGVTWTRMPLQTNPYTGDLNSTFNPTGAGAAFTGSAQDYFESAGLIPDGAQRVRFTFSEDVGGGGGDGWWIDDVKIVVNPVDITNEVEVTDPIVSGGRTHTSRATTLIFNTICDEINRFITQGPIADGTNLFVRDTITIEGNNQTIIVPENSDVELRAGNEILIKRRFETKEGATLLLDIQDCDEN